MNLSNYTCQLNVSPKFQKAFLIELGKLGIQAEVPDSRGESHTRNLTDENFNSLIRNNFITTGVEAWRTQYAYNSADREFRFLITEPESDGAISLLDEFRRLEESLGIKVVEAAAMDALDLNQYGFSNNLLKSWRTVGKGNEAHEELDWDFNKFSDVLVANLPFVTWAKEDARGIEVERSLFLFTVEEGYNPFGPDEMDTLLQTLGVPDDLIEKQYRALTKRITNHQSVRKFSEWNTSLIACKNGVLDPWTLKLRPHSPDDLVKNRLAASWNPEAKHEMVDKLFEAFPDPVDCAMIKSALAITLVGNRKQNFFVQKGVSGTGKSTTTDAWALVLGRALYTVFYAQHAFTGDASRFGCQQMDTAFMAVCDDLTNQKITDDGIFKSLTGGNNISVQYKGKDAYNAKARAVVIINSNAVPNFEDKTGAILRRCRFINRDYELKDRSFNLADYQDDEDFKSRMLYLVMKEFQNMIVRDEKTGRMTYELPEESEGAKKLREEARNKGVSVLEPFEVLLQEQRIIGKKRADIDDDLAETYYSVVGYKYTPMGNDPLNNTLHSQGFQNGLRLQIYKKDTPVALIRGKWTLRIKNVLAFSSLNPDEREKWGMYAVRYNEVMTGEAVRRCNELAETDPAWAQREWAKFEEAYEFTIEKIRQYYPDSVDVYEVKRNSEGFAPELALAVPVA